MAIHRLGIIMHGITGRMGKNQHLARSVMEIIREGGVVLSNGDKVIPDPLLLGRNLEKVLAVAKEFHINNYTDDYEKALNSADHTLFFDAGSTSMRPDLLRKAIRAAKDIYCEKPLCLDLQEAEDICKLAQNKGVKTGIVQDKLFLPGLLKLKKLIDRQFFGRILSVKIDFGYWVFTGEEQPAQRPSWNYRKKDGGGIIFDMLSHWRYILDNLFGQPLSISCLGINHMPERWDENKLSYEADADDAAYTIVQLENGIIAQINSTWCTRVYRDDLVSFQVDGTKGSAISGLTSCKYQSINDTPCPVWNPDEPQKIDFRSQWKELEDDEVYENGFKKQWTQFIRHLFEDTPWLYDLSAGARGVQMAEAAMKSWKEKRWVDIEKLNVS